MECKDEASDTDSGIILQSGLDSPTYPVKDMPTHTRAVKLRQQSLEDKLESCRLELRKLCIREAELTGILSKEFPLKPGEKAPNVRRRIGAAFKLDDLSILQQGSDPKLSSLEAELALQFQIYEAARRLSLEENISRHMKKNRLNQCEKEQKKLKELQQAVNELHTKAGHKPLHPGSQLQDPDPHGSDDSSLSDAALLEDEGVPALTPHPVCETSSPAALPPHSSPLPPTHSHRPLPPQTLEGLILGLSPSLEYDRSPIQNTAWRESSLDQPYEKPKKTNSAASSQSSSPAGTPVSTPVDFRLGDVQLPYQFSPIMKLPLPLRHTHSSSAPSTPEMQGRWVHSQSVRLPSSDPSHDPLESRGRSRLPRRQSANFMMTSQDHPFPQPRMNLSNPLYHSGSEDSNSDYSTPSYTSSSCQERMPELVRPGLPPYPGPPQNNCYPGFYKNPQNHSSPNFYPPHGCTEGGRGYLRESDLGRGYLIESDQGRGYLRESDPGRGYLRESDPGRGHLIESDQGRGYLIESDPGRGYLRESDSGRVYLRESDSGRGYLGECDSGRGYLRESDPGRGYLRESDPGRGYLRESDPRRGYLQPPPPLLWDHPCRQYRYDDDPAPRRVMQRPFPAQVKLARAPSLKDYPQSASQRGLPREVVSEELQSWHVRTVFRSVRPRSLDRQGAIRVRSNTPGRESPLTRQPVPHQQTPQRRILQRAPDGTPVQWYVEEESEIISQV
ncbi:innate immunity activator protein-like [Acipenser ruthenus]|uniref:innate immunity activator protein-like n=1 Tax=Acipenser ruthenus TaxID=7906 RepID=UPI0027419AAE|nr:innate immunity activator protein-like [Acipenser ruthenus]XP_058860791.1 innate immunity activator protein-like [Acipenser ruthenus]